MGLELSLQPISNTLIKHCRLWVVEQFYMTVFHSVKNTLLVSVIQFVETRPDVFDIVHHPFKNGKINNGGSTQ